MLTISVVSSFEGVFFVLIIAIVWVPDCVVVAHLVIISVKYLSH